MAVLLSPLTSNPPTTTIHPRSPPRALAPARSLPPRVPLSHPHRRNDEGEDGGEGRGERGDGGERRDGGGGEGVERDSSAVGSQAKVPLSNKEVQVFVRVAVRARDRDQIGADALAVVEHILKTGDAAMKVSIYDELTRCVGEEIFSRSVENGSWDWQAAVFGFDWETAEDAVVEAFTAFLLELVSLRPFFQVQIFDMVARAFCSLANARARDGTSAEGGGCKVGMTDEEYDQSVAWVQLLVKSMLEQNIAYLQKLKEALQWNLPGSDAMPCVVGWYLEEVLSIPTYFAPLFAWAISLVSRVTSSWNTAIQVRPFPFPPTSSPCRPFPSHGSSFFMSR